MLPPKVKSWLRQITFLSIARRLLVLLLVTIALSAVLNRPSDPLKPAGFGRGMLDGALMPGAMPPLFFGRDVSIYTRPNTGRTYNLGYTVGVNGCGALFFGFFFWRFASWKKKRAERVQPLSDGTC
ncbi:MAG: hypothetical protein ABJC04_12215 [Verrucomicrobiota bacterium]